MSRPRTHACVIATPKTTQHPIKHARADCRTRGNHRQTAQTTSTHGKMAATTSVSIGPVNR